MVTNASMVGALRAFRASPAPQVWPLVAGIGIATAAYGIRLALNAARQGGLDAAGDSPPPPAETRRDARSVRTHVDTQAGKDAVGGSVSTVLGIAIGDTSLRTALKSPSEPNVARVVETLEGHRFFPAAFALGRDGEQMLGLAALRRRFEPGAAVVLCPTTMLGERADSEVAKGCTKWLRDSAPIEALPDGRAAFRLHGWLRLPEELSSSMLEEVLAAARVVAGRPVWRAVFALHAGASEAHATAVRAAAVEIGLLDVAIVSAPVAAFEAVRAALGSSDAGGSGWRAESPSLVFHMGGRRASASVVSGASADGGGAPVRLLASRQALFAAGEAHDEAVLALLAAGFETEHGIDLRADRLALSRLQDAAELARHELSSAQSTVVNIPFITANASGPLHLRLELSRAQLEALVGELTPVAHADSIESLCRDALASAGVRPSELGGLVLTGGMMRTPALRARVERAVSLRAASVSINPEDMITVGAALPLFAPRAAAAAQEAAAGAQETA